MKTKIKICGIKDINNAKVVIDNNADYLGLNFIQESKRYINESKSESLVKEIKNYKLKKNSQIKLAGLFANENYNHINKFSELLDIDVIQLCGNENVKYIKKITKPVIKQIHIKETNDFSEILSDVEMYFSVEVRNPESFWLFLCCASATLMAQTFANSRIRKIFEFGVN